MSAEGVRVVDTTLLLRAGDGPSHFRRSRYSNPLPAGTHGKGIEKESGPTRRPVPDRLTSGKNQMKATTQHPFSVEESLALLRRIFPNYPDLKDTEPIPDLETFLEAYRSESSKLA